MCMDLYLVDIFCMNVDLMVVLCGNYFVSCVIDPFWRALKKLYGSG